jgi:ABC-type branched-subunit amino acid transport system substrate-binding protein
VEHRRAGIALVALLLATNTACTRGDTASPEPEGTTTTQPSDDPDGATALAQGGFGDLESVCQPGDASGATATGVSDAEIHIGTVTDKGYAGSPGVNKEMYDAAVAFERWCNDHGGILGRRLVVDDLDAALSEYEARLTEACEQDFALVGGGAVFDEDPNDVRVGCNLPNVPGYVVSARGRAADLQVQALPNPIEHVSLGRYLAARRDFPEAIDHYAVIATNVPSVLLVRDQIVQAAEGLGYTVAYSVAHAPLGETGWGNYVAEMQQKGVRILEYIGPPDDFVELNRAMDTAGWAPDVVLISANVYDSTYQAEAASIAPNLYIQTAYHPFELAGSEKATQDYLDVMEQYNPSGKVALLGAQAMSALLLFATAATECGSDLTATCLLDAAAAREGWTGGGLHAPQTPGNETPSPCFLLLGLTPTGFVYDEEATQPTDGLYNCDPENVMRYRGG